MGARLHDIHVHVNRAQRRPLQKQSDCCDLVLQLCKKSMHNGTVGRVGAAFAVVEVVLVAVVVVVVVVLVVVLVVVAALFLSSTACLRTTSISS